VVSVASDWQQSARAPGRQEVALVTAGAAGDVPGLTGGAAAAVEALCRAAYAGQGPLVVDDCATAAGSATPQELRTPDADVVAACLGVPLRSDHGRVGALCVFSPAPRSWSQDDVRLLSRLAAPVVAELELAALSTEYEAGRVFFELALDFAGIGAFDWDLTTGELRWDERLLELFGLDAGTFGGTIEAFNESVHPEDLPRVSQALSSAIECCGEYTAEYRILLPEGRVRWVAARGRAMCGPEGSAVRVLGAAYDTTAVQEQEARVARVLEAMPTAFFQLDASWRFRYVNAEAERLLGAGRDQLVGGVLWELFPASVASDFETHYRRAATTGDPVSFDAYYPSPLEAWYEVRAWPSPDGLAVYFIDVTARHAAAEQLERGARRSALLAEVTKELTGTLEAEEAVGRLAPLVVPDLADWCVVTLVGDDEHPDWRRRLRDVGWWHADPALRPDVDRYAQIRVAALTDSSFVARALASGEPVVVAQEANDQVTAVLGSAEAQSLCRRLDPASAVVVPLRGRDRTVGLLSVFRGAARAPFGSEDVDVVAEVAGRAGLALDNARLFAQQRDLAEGLQRNLLTAPVEPEHMEVVVRYEPAAETAQVGGDWYDSFFQSADATVLVIGDMVGHDTAAAAAMGQVRSMLRAVAVHTGQGPAAVLRGVDQAMEALKVDATATAVVARLEQTAQERERGVSRLRWSNAGHPPPMVLEPDGTVRSLGRPGADLLLGLDPGTPRAETVVGLGPGATVLLYTDGLVERRGQSLDEGLALLTERLAAAARRGLGVADLCDELLRVMLPARPEDDVALVAVRLRGEDGGAEVIGRAAEG
jgi:PAS domain S-box-containing protein